MKREKKYLFILLGFLMAILYLHPVSALAEEAQKITVSYQYIDDFEKVTKNSDSIDDAINGMGEGAGKITFTAYESGDVYLEFYTDAALYTTIDVSAVVK